MKTVWNILLLFAIFPFASNLFGQSVERPSGDPCSKIGCVSVPFTKNITQDKIANSLQALLGEDIKIDEGELSNYLRKKLIIEHSSVLSLFDLDDKVNQLTNDALEQLDIFISNYNTGVDIKINLLSERVKSRMDSYSPKAEFSGTYYYKCSDENTGNPGWIISDKITNGDNLPIKVELSLPISVTLVLGLGIEGQISINSIFEFKTSAHIKPNFIHVLPPFSPESPVTGIAYEPIINIELSYEIKAGLGLIVSLSDGVVIPLYFDLTTTELTAGMWNCNRE